MKNYEIKTKRASETGSALVYILIAIALLAALTASFMRPSSQQTSAQGSFNAISELRSQIQFSRSAIDECVLTYPAGDNGFANLNKPYPLNPSNTYLTSQDANDNLEHIRCPGNPGNDADHADIFGGVSGKFLPPPPNLFEGWEYYNGVDGVFFFNRTDKSDAFIETALQKLDDNYSECQADVIVAAGSDEDLTSTAAADDPVCEAGEKCFRLWVKINASAVYPGDADGEESSTTTPTHAGCPTDPAPS